MPLKIRRREPLRSAIDMFLFYELEKGEVLGLKWVNKAQGLFKIPWMHKSTKGWHKEKHAALLEKYENLKGRRTDKRNFANIKARFRNALNRCKKLRCVSKAVASAKSKKDPFRIYQFKEQITGDIGDVSFQIEHVDWSTYDAENLDGGHWGASDNAVTTYKINSVMQQPASAGGNLPDFHKIGVMDEVMERSLRDSVEEVGGDGALSMDWEQSLGISNSNNLAAVWVSDVSAEEYLFDYGNSEFGNYNTLALENCPDFSSAAQSCDVNQPHSDCQLVGDASSHDEDSMSSQMRLCSLYTPSITDESSVESSSDEMLVDETDSLDDSGLQTYDPAQYVCEQMPLGTKDWMETRMPLQNYSFWPAPDLSSTASSLNTPTTANPSAMDVTVHNDAHIPSVDGTMSSPGASPPLIYTTPPPSPQPPTLPTSNSNNILFNDDMFPTSAHFKDPFLNIIANSDSVPASSPLFFPGPLSLPNNPGPHTYFPSESLALDTGLFPELDFI